MRHFEFWPPRLFELPYYVGLLAGCALRGLQPKDLARANYALDHGEIGIGSKAETQFQFPQERFLPTEHLPDDETYGQRRARGLAFAAATGYPLVLKPDRGSVGKGIVRIDGPAELDARLKQITGPYLLQQFTTLPVEHGVFYTRYWGQPRITGVNRKHFPRVTGDGTTALGELASRHERFTHHWHAFLQYHDLQRVPAAGETVQLSFIGSHTLGCKFTDDSAGLTPELAAAVFALFETQPGFNFGRIDVKSASVDAFWRGEFTVIEVNGVASLPTHMFDPRHSLARGYGIFFEHARHLLRAATEQRHQSMSLASYREIIAAVGRSAGTLEANHSRLMGEATE
ncbi:MAG: hypothetical protein AAF515_09475 [Pseudomonadota bacterium]